MALAAPFPAARPVSRPVRRPAARHLPARGATVRRSTGGSLRLTRRGRVVLGLLSAVFLFAVVLFSGQLSADAGSSAAQQGVASSVVVVQPGESLWQIAKAVAPGADPRETVTRIRELNNLAGSTVVAGQSIVVPAA